VVLISNPLHEGDIAALKATCLRNIWNMVCEI
jgi:hypothetical protein